MKQPPTGARTRPLAALELLPLEAEIVAAIRNRKSLSRSELARIVGYSRANMTPVVSKLLHTGILNEQGEGVSQGGRRPRLLKLNEQLGYVAGIDIGATSIDVVLANFGGQPIQHLSLPADVRDGPEVVLGHVATLLNSLLSQNSILPERVYAVGVGVPGPVEFSTGLLIAPPIMPGWEAYPIRSYLRTLLPVANVIVDNDVNVMALGELRAGAGVGIDNFIFVKIGTGIGSGIVCHGFIYRGSDGCAGDIGHICVDREGPVCHCGNTGCLEAVAAGPPLAAKAMEAARNGTSANLARRMEFNNQLLTAEDVGAAAGAGDPVSNKLIQDAGRLIGETLASLVNFYNPRLILIGGGVAHIGHQLLSSIRQAVFQRSLPLSTRALRIEYASLGTMAGTTGAVWLALEHVFSVAVE